MQNEIPIYQNSELERIRKRVASQFRPRGIPVFSIGGLTLDLDGTPDGAVRITLADTVAETSLRPITELPTTMGWF